MAVDEVIILSDPKGKCYKFVEKVYDYLLSKPERDFELKLTHLNIHVFRDKEEKIKIEENVREKQCFFIHDSNKEPQRWLAQLAFVNEALNNSSASKITNVLPYLKFSRQDRKDESRVAVNAKTVADIINLYANRVLTVDVHNPAIALAYKIPFDNLYTFPTVVEYLFEKHKEKLENLSIMSPDAGGTSRAKAFRNKLIEIFTTKEKNKIHSNDFDLVIGYKTRPKEGEVSEEYEIVGDVKDKNILIVDDIIDSGNTLIKALKKVKERGAKRIYSYATHGLFTEGIDKLANEFDRIFVSDTIYVEPNEKLEVISVANLIGEAIFRTIKGQSLSELFELKKEQ